MTSLFCQMFKDESAAVLALVALAISAFVGLGALVADVGYLFYAEHELQATANAAAMAGAQAINIVGASPTTTAYQYSAATSGCSPSPCYNANKIAINSGSSVTATPITLYYCTDTSSWSCSSCTSVSSCSGTTSPANAIQVTETASQVSTFFGRLFGINSVALSATATALAAGGGPPAPSNIALILDTTKSMGSAAVGPAASVCPSSTYANALDCALAGIQTLLSEMWPCQYGASCPTTTAVDQAALFIFPGVTFPKGVTSSNYNCSKSQAPTAQPYSPVPTYEIVSFLGNYRTSDTATTVADGVAGGNTSSDLVDCVAPASVGTSLGNGNNTSWEGGEGTYYAGAITAAQNALTALNNGATNVIILLTDGNAYYQSGDGMPSSNDCKAAATAAQAAAKAGTWVYAVYYDDNGTGGTCANDSGNYTGAAPDGACYTLQQIASSPAAQPDPTKFYSTDGTSSPCKSLYSYSKLTDIFDNIAGSLTSGRLIPNV
jgi:Putative Tad-like Flp pilus-assembly